MDRISALRNVEEALADFESGDADLATTEERVVAVLRTYATEFESGDADLATYRALGDEAADGLVVVAAGREEARERIVELVGSTPDFDLERVE